MTRKDFYRNLFDKGVRDQSIAKDYEQKWFDSGHTFDDVATAVVEPQEPAQISTGVTRSFEEPEKISTGVTRSFEEPTLPKQIPLYSQEEGHQIAVDAFNKLPEDERKRIGDELTKQMLKEDYISPFLTGLAESTPAPIFMSEEQKEFMKKAKEAHPLVAGGGQITGTIAQAIVGGGAIAKGLGKLAPIAQSPLLKTALTRVLTTGAIAAEQNIGRKDLGEAMKDVAQQSGGGLISIVPEVLAPPGVAQLIAQPLTDLIYDVAAGSIRGENVGSKDWWKNEIISLASSAGFAIRDVASGKTFELEQTAQRNELINLLDKGQVKDIQIEMPKGVTDVPEVQGKTETEIKPIEELESKIADVPREQTVTEPLPEVAAPAKPEEPGITEKITGMEEQPSPLTMGGIAAGQELPKYAGNINLERISADYEPKRAILETSANYEGKIDEARRGKITHQETRKLADELGMSEKELLRRKKGQAFNAEQILASRDWLNSSANRIIELQKEIVTKRSKGTLTDKDLADFSLELKKHAAIQAEVAGITAEAGRALNSFKIMSEAKKKAKSVEEILDIAGGKEINQEIIDKLAQIDPENTAALNQFVRKSVFAKTTDAVYEYWINAILSAPTTHMVNFTSNTATGLYRTLLEKPASAAIDRVAAKIQKRPVERYFGEVPAEVHGFVQGLPEAVGAFKDTWKTGIPATGTKLEGIKPEGVIPGIAGKFIRTPTRFLSAADEFFKTIIYRGSINSLAFRKAKGEGKKGIELKQRIDELVKDPSNSMINKAKEEAAYRTFTNPLGDFGKSVMDMRRKTPGLKYIIPFIKTPTNIAKFALERTPGISQAIEVSKIKKGDIKGAQISDEIAKGAVGSMLALTAVALAREGLITGGGPKDKKERDSLYRTGWIPYSLKLGDKYYSFSRLEPIASVIGMAADFATMNTDEMSDNHLTDMATKISLSFGKNITSKTFMQGFSNLLDAISDPKRYGEQWINRMIGSLIPNIIAAGARATDDELKKINNISETIMSRIPGLTQQVNPRRNIWGEEIIKTATGLEAFLSPVQISEESENDVDKELLRLKYNPSMPSARIQHRGATIELDSKTYDVYSEHAGKYAKGLIQSKLKSRKYKLSSDEDKIDIIKNEFSDARKRYKNSAIRMQLRRNKIKSK